MPKNRNFKRPAATIRKKHSNSSIKITNYKKHVAVKIKFNFKGNKNG